MARTPVPIASRDTPVLFPIVQENQLTATCGTSVDLGILASGHGTESWCTDGSCRGTLNSYAAMFTVAQCPVVFESSTVRFP